MPITNYFPLLWKCNSLQFHYNYHYNYPRSGSGSQCGYFSHEPSSLFHHSVLVDLSVSMMMH